MNALTLENIAQSCTPEAFIGLLKEWAEIKFGDAFTGIRMGLDIISEAIQSPGHKLVAHAVRKNELLTNYVAKLEPFAPKQQLSPSVEEEFRAVIKDLTTRLAKAEQEINELKAAKPVKSNPAPKPPRS